jgi:hypothetical protein
MRSPTIAAAALALGALPLLGGMEAQAAAGSGQEPPPQAARPAPAERKEPTLALEERYRARLPQPIEAGRLLGLEVVDEGNHVVGKVRDVIRMRDGTVQVVFDYLSFLWREGEHVPVPIEAVALAGQRLAILDMPREVVEKRMTWYGIGGASLPPGEKVAIAMIKR